VDDFARQANVSSRIIEADLSFLKKQGLIVFIEPRKTGSVVLFFLALLIAGKSKDNQSQAELSRISPKKFDVSSHLRSLI